MSVWQRRLTLAAVAMVAIVAAVVSYEHMREVAEFAGEDWRAWLLPLSVDGLVIAGSLAAWQAKRNGERVPEMTVASLATGLLVSVSANVLVPFLGALGPEAQAWLSAGVAAWPAVALALAFEELLRLKGSDAVTETTEALPAETVSVTTERDQTPVPALTDSDPEAEAHPAEGWPAVHDQGQQDVEPIPDVEEVPAPRVEEVPEPAEARSAAMEALREDPSLSATELGEMFGRSARWARDVRKDFREQTETAPRLAVV